MQHDMHSDERTVKRYKEITGRLEEAGYPCSRQVTNRTKLWEEHVEFYIGKHGAVVAVIRYPIKNRETIYTEAAYFEAFLPITTENSTAAEAWNLTDFLTNGRPSVKVQEHLANVDAQTVERLKNGEEASAEVYFHGVWTPCTLHYVRNEVLNALFTNRASTLFTTTDIRDSKLFRRLTFTADPTPEQRVDEAIAQDEATRND